ncbi:MAG: hypothetical protein LPK25_00245 [Cyclobacteriaceae bacterium]|nr:hypothetical protein [Cyclobacteriaceae bacterium]MDX5465268.1 hypothetical protein [Cyclobacteriaceae bacterium]
MIRLVKSVSPTKGLVILGILFIAFNAMIPQFLPKDQALDLKFAYSREDVINSLSQLSSSQIADYKFGLLALDMPYLVTYSLLLAGVLFRLWGNTSIVYIPFIAAFADLLENLAVLKILNVFPAIGNSIVVLASVSTTAKWILAGIIVLGILAGVLKKLFYKKYALVDSGEIKI